MIMETPIPTHRYMKSVDHYTELYQSHQEVELLDQTKTCLDSIDRTNPCGDLKLLHDLDRIVSHLEIILAEHELLFEELHLLQRAHLRRYIPSVT